MYRYVYSNNKGPIRWDISTGTRWPGIYGCSKQTSSGYAFGLPLFIAINPWHLCYNYNKRYMLWYELAVVRNQIQGPLLESYLITSKCLHFQNDQKSCAVTIDCLPSSCVPAFPIFRHSSASSSLFYLLSGLALCEGEGVWV